jgi:hypothetical protein
MEHTEFSSLGGKARAKKLSKKRRSQIGALGGKAGKGKLKPRRKNAVEKDKSAAELRALNHGQNVWSVDGASSRLLADTPLIKYTIMSSSVRSARLGLTE